MRDVLQTEKKVNNIKIKVISVHDDNIIVVDSSMQAICSAPNSAFKKMVEGECYQLVKPIKQDMNFFIPNEKLQPIKIPNFLVHIKKSETTKLLALIQTDQKDKPLSSGHSTPKFTTFSKIQQLTAKAEVKAVTVKIITISMLRILTKSFQNRRGPN